MLTILSALSLLLCVEATVLWVRSHLRGDGFACWTEKGQSQVIVNSERGSVRFHHISYGYRASDGPAVWRHEVYSLDPSARAAWWSRTTHDFMREGPSWKRHGRYRVKYRNVTLLLMVMPTIWVVAGFRKARANAGSFCRFCGYDLRATPERCPECGKGVA